MERNRIVKKIMLYVQVRFRSPLNVSSGEDEWTDADLLRDGNGDVFVPGSSLAGAMRAYIKKEKNEPCLLGYSKHEANGLDTGKMSALFISDLTFDESPLSGVRDGVELNAQKTAKSESKYDMEILEAGSKAHFFLELTVREQDNEKEMQQEIGKVFRGINEGEIRLGSKKTRGFGEFEILSVSEKEYTKENYADYANAYQNDFWRDAENKLQKWMEKADGTLSMVHIEVPLRMKGGISIRRYAAKKGEPDYAHLTRPVIQTDENGKETDRTEIAVLPGNSLAGALRHRMETIIGELKEAGVKFPKNRTSTDIINIIFGYVNGDQGCASNIIVHEVDIKGAKPLAMVRTGVSRFESAVRKGSLYTEKTYVDGTLNVRIDVRKGDNPQDEAWIIGILLLVLKDLQNGLLAVGGQTAIGRGIFSANGPITIDGIPIDKTPIDKILDDEKTIAGNSADGTVSVENFLIGNLLKNMPENGGGKA